MVFGKTVTNDAMKLDARSFVHTPRVIQPASYRLRKLYRVSANFLFDIHKKFNVQKLFLK